MGERRGLSASAGDERDMVAGGERGEERRGRREGSGKKMGGRTG